MDAILQHEVARRRARRAEEQLCVDDHLNNAEQVQDSAAHRFPSRETSESPQRGRASTQMTEPDAQQSSA